MVENRCNTENISCVPQFFFTIIYLIVKFKSDEKIMFFEVISNRMSIFFQIRLAANKL